MRIGSQASGRGEIDDIFQRFFETRSPWPAGGYEVPTEVFHVDDALIIRMDLPGVDADAVEVTVQENTLLINGRREFSYDADKVRFVRRGTFYGDFAQRVALGKGLNTDGIAARFDNGVLELKVPYAEEVQPKKIAIDVGGNTALDA